MKLCLRWVSVLIILFISIFTPTFYRVINAKFPRAKSCTNRTLLKLIHLPLSITLHDDMNITNFERSGCFVIDTGKSGLYRIIHGKNFAHITCHATEKKFLSNSQNNTNTALASIPGSGNTWTRHLLEEVTGLFLYYIGVMWRDCFQDMFGIYTGSIYKEKTLKKVFPGESMQHNVVAVKTHGTRDIQSYNRAILVVRDPFESALAEYNRQRTTSQVSRIEKENFDKTAFIGRFVNPLLKSPKIGFNVRWIKQLNGDILVLFYEKLRTDLLNSLLKMAAFTNSEMTLAKLWCILQNQTGLFHREPRPEWMSRESLINEGIEKAIRVWKRTVQKAIDNRVQEIATN